MLLENLSQRDPVVTPNRDMHELRRIIEQL